MKRKNLSLLVALTIAQACVASVQNHSVSAQSSYQSLSVSSILTAAAVPAQADAGKYENLLKTIACPADQKQYGNFADTGHFEALNYCGHSAPAGYWVWVSPNWYIWGGLKSSHKPAEKPADTSNIPTQARVGGKYKDLLQRFDCPAKRAEEKTKYGRFADTGFFEATTYCGQRFPAAHWVYVAPNWYLWKTKDLNAIGYQVSTRDLQLKQQRLTLRFEHHKSHRAWAETSLNQLVATLKNIEEMTGIPYPGVNPYTLVEDPKLPLLGRAGPGGMELISPPKGTPWTILHEAVHIWNAGYEPNWVVEGHANYFSYLLMEKLKYPFIGDETYPEYIREWREIQGKADDYPLDNNYHKLPQGKAMAWWAMIHELYGPAFTIKTFKVLHDEKNLGTARMAQLLREVSGKDPAPLLDGWVRAGSYKVKRSQDFGLLKFPLAKAWP